MLIVVDTLGRRCFCEVVWGTDQKEYIDISRVTGKVMLYRIDKNLV